MPPGRWSKEKGTRCGWRRHVISTENGSCMQKKLTFQSGQTQNNSSVAFLLHLIVFRKFEDKKWSAGFKLVLRYVHSYNIKEGVRFFATVLYIECFELDFFTPEGRTWEYFLQILNQQWCETNNKYTHYDFWMQWRNSNYRTFYGPILLFWSHFIVYTK